MAELVISAPPLSLFDGHLAATWHPPSNEVPRSPARAPRSPGRRRDAAAGARHGRPGLPAVMTGDS